MNGISAVTGKDVLVINGNIFTGLADGDAIKIEPQGPISDMKISKDGNSIYAMKYSGIAVKLTVRLVRACFDDVFLNGLLQQWISQPSLFTLLSGSYVKSMGDGKGNETSEIYELAGGIFEMVPGGVTNMDGSVEQAVTTYTFLFRNDARLMQ